MGQTLSRWQAGNCVPSGGIWASSCPARSRYSPGHRPSSGWTLAVLKTERSGQQIARLDRQASAALSAEQRLECKAESAVEQNILAVMPFRGMLCLRLTGRFQDLRNPACRTLDAPHILQAQLPGLLLGQPPWGGEDLAQHNGTFAFWVEIVPGLGRSEVLVDLHQMPVTSSLAFANYVQSSARSWGDDL